MSSTPLDEWISKIRSGAEILVPNGPTLGPPDTIWYRGEIKDSSWTLRPAVGRKGYSVTEINSLERALFHNFSNRGASHIPAGADSWDVVCMMQHYGIPTRLLDWTVGFATALFFSLENATKDKPPRIWQLNARLLNKVNGYTHSLLDMKGPDSDYYKDYIIAPREAKVAAFAYPRFHPRMIAQAGMFTIHSDPTLELNKMTHSDKFLKEYVLPGELIEDAKGFLRFMGIDRYVLFPDVENLGRSLREDFLD